MMPVMMMIMMMVMVMVMMMVMMLVVVNMMVSMMVMMVSVLLVVTIPVLLQSKRQLLIITIILFQALYTPMKSITSIYLKSTENFGQRTGIDLSYQIAFFSALCIDYIYSLDTLIYQR